MTGETPRQIPWVEWCAIVFWILLGGTAAFFIPTVRPIFDTFGADLPFVTKAWLACRPLFFAAYAGAIAAAVRLFLRRRSPPDPRWRPYAWGFLTAASVASVWSFWALAAPQFIGTLAGKGD